METIKLKVLDEVGHTLMTCDADTEVSLVYTNEYHPGDRVALEIDHPGQYCVVQFEDTMPPALVYVVKREINFHIPFGEQAITYSPKSFAGSRHVIRARLAGPEEISARRNLAFNCYDEHGDTGFYPHASANVETRGEAVFAARNAIDGIFENSAHGEYPYQSWGNNRDPHAALPLEAPADASVPALLRRAGKLLLAAPGRCIAAGVILLVGIGGMILLFPVSVFWAVLFGFWLPGLAAMQTLFPALRSEYDVELHSIPRPAAPEQPLSAQEQKKRSRANWWYYPLGHRGRCCRGRRQRCVCCPWPDDCRGPGLHRCRRDGGVPAG